ncbi:nucleotide exchange factor GrpE [Cryptosporangium phraense]|uniref:Protein GrpE n=1 Tax=Cryptosporangium phraense TaxID=2593070 RepID=A0A545AI44_9ACTN|nr:nucleotide exchange factor GrpE [Cryptosporangium phraense]TQS40989.1 nucleotide exchange factor GrpE [Cryptosporangium phraense]
MSATNDGHSEEQPKVVIRDRRRIDPETGAPREVAVASVGGDAAGASAPAGAADAPSDGGSLVDTPADHAAGAHDGVGEGGGMGATEVSEQTSGGEAVAKLTTELAERTADLKRVTAEYANYRRRVDRDRQVGAEQARGEVLTALLPVLDDLDRARAHGDLTGPFGAVAEQLTAILTKLGLNAFGEKGDPFDPTFHEAVAHTTSPDVTETACIEVLRKGYTLGDRLLRAAMVAVADPAGGSGSEQNSGVETSGESSAE